MNSYNWQSGCPNYQMTAFVFFIFRSAGEREGWFEGDSTWLIDYKGKSQKHRQPPSCIVKFLQILCSSCIRLILVYSLVVLGEGGGGKERFRYYNFFPKHSFLFFHYHQMNLLYSFIISKILVYIFNFFLQTLEIQ